MGNQSSATKAARKIEKLYRTKDHGTKHSTVMRLLSERGFEGCLRQLEEWGMRPDGGVES